MIPKNILYILIRKEKERAERVERIKVREMLCRMEEAQK